MTQAKPPSKVEIFRRRVAAFWRRFSKSSDNQPGRGWTIFLHAMLIVLGTLSFLWVLAIGCATLFPSVMPQSFQSDCSSESEVNFSTGKTSEDKGQPFTEYKEKPESPIHDASAQTTQSVKFNQKCQRTPIPSDNIIAAGALTGFFFLGIIGPLLPKKIDTPLGSIEGWGPPSSLAASAKNAADAGEQTLLSASGA
jgi:hypothetical protein